MSITHIGEFQAAPGKQESLYDFLQSLIPYISSSPGCLSCEVLRNIEKPDNFFVVEKWSSVEDHRKSLAGFPKEDMQSAMTLFGSPPKGGYYS